MLSSCRAIRSTVLRCTKPAKLEPQKRSYASVIYDTGLPAQKYTVKQTGKLGTLEYRAAVLKDGVAISPWHDIAMSDGKSLIGDRLVNMVMEIPKGTRAKMEMLPTESGHPIVHDTNSKGEIRYMNYSPVLYNYGFIPQTWEDPTVTHPDTNCLGDGDPIDVIDIGFRRREVGEVYRVKILGSFALIDEGETDWKVIAISLDDPAATKINSLAGIEKHKPGITFTLRDWYKNYKTADGKDENSFAFKGEIKDAEYTFQVLDDAHQQWKKIAEDADLSKKYHKKN